MAINDYNSKENKTDTYIIPTDEELQNIAIFTETELCRVDIKNRDWIGKYIRIYLNLDMRRDKKFIVSLINRMVSQNLIKAIKTPYSGKESHIYKRPNAGFSGKRPGGKIVVQSKEEMVNYIENTKNPNGIAQAESAVAQSD